jgi:ATP-dependent DNA helicase RecQ
VFSDATLRDMARRRPSSLEQLLEVNGVGQKKAADFGEQFLGCITTYCNEHDVGMDVKPKPAAVRPPTAMPSASALTSFPMFDEGLSVEQVAERLGRAVSTTNGYLESYVKFRKPADISAWVPRQELQQIEELAQNGKPQRLKEIYEALGGRVGYDRIRIAMAFLANRYEA